MGDSKSILYLVTEDWYFCLHRLPIARAARDAGYTVIVLTQVKDHKGTIEREGFQLIPMKWARESLSPLRALNEIWQIVRVYREYKPQLVHHVALKPSLYGSIAAGFTGISPVVNNLAGLGQVFTAEGVISKVVRWVLVKAMRILFNRRGAYTIVENEDDRKFLVSSVGISERTVILIRGIGVDERKYVYSKESNEEAGGTPVVTMVSRMLWPKGVGELVEASRILRDRGIKVSVQLVGVPDYSSRVYVPESKLKEWEEEGVVTWLGHRDDIPDIWRRSNIAVLPSYYREGIPRSLLEAASCGRALVATDMPGCREVVKHGETGLTVPPKDASALADALETLIKSPNLRKSMGERGRKLVEKDLTERHVVDQTLKVYEKLLNKTHAKR